ncbi:MAG TPA: VCBS repeat-containing protein, partial [Urbifossiella sp.]
LGDTDGAISTPTPITGTENWLTPTSATGIDLIGPQSATGTFDVSTFKLQAGWTNSDNSTGALAVTLAPKTSTPTDLSFSNTAAVIAPDGTVTLDFTANVTGDPMQAAAEDIAASSVSAVWEGNGQTQATDLNIPIYWNTGNVVAHVTGLTPPSWATKLIVKIDAGNAVAESDETNNTWTVSMSDLVPPVPPPPPPPPPVVASYALVPGVETILQWRSATGAVIAQAPAIDGYGGPISMASGDVNGDGIPDVVVAAGEGGGPRIRVMDGKTGAVLSDFFAFDPSFRGGTNIALGDLSGDGQMELIAGAGASGGPQVTVFDPITGNTIRSFVAYDPTSRGGVSVAAADVTGDGKDEIITTPGAGEDPALLVIDGTSNAEDYQAPLTGMQPNQGVAVTASVDASTGASVITATEDDGTVLAKFRSQLAASEPLLVPLPTGPVLMTS